MGLKEEGVRLRLSELGSGFENGSAPWQLNLGHYVLFADTSESCSMHPFRGHGVQTLGRSCLQGLGSGFRQRVPAAKMVHKKV